MLQSVEFVLVKAAVDLISQVISSEFGVIQSIGPVFETNK